MLDSDIKECFRSGMDVYDVWFTNGILLND